MLADPDSDTTQFVLIADAGLHQNLGRVDRPERQHYFGTRAEVTELSLVQHLHTGDRGVVEGQTLHHRMREDRQVRQVHEWIRVGAEHRLALSVADSQVGDRRSRGGFHHLAVGAFICRDANRSCAFENGQGQRIGVGRRLDEDRPASAAMRRVRRALPVLDAAIDVQDRLVTPGRVGALGRKVVPVSCDVRAPRA